MNTMTINLSELVRKSLIGIGIFALGDVKMTVTAPKFTALTHVGVASVVALAGALNMRYGVERRLAAGIDATVAGVASFAALTHTFTDIGKDIFVFSMGEKKYTLDDILENYIKREEGGAKGKEIAQKIADSKDAEVVGRITASVSTAVAVGVLALMARNKVGCRSSIILAQTLIATLMPSVVYSLYLPHSLGLYVEAFILAVEQPYIKDQ